MGDTAADRLELVWRKDGNEARLEADLSTYGFRITAVDGAGRETFRFVQ